MEQLRTNPNHSSKFWASKAMTLNWTLTHQYNPMELGFITDTELNFDYEKSVPLVEELYGKRLWMFTALYIAFVFGGRSAMGKRPAFVLKGLLNFWNISLALMSILGAVRTVPEAMVHVHDHGVYPSVCLSSFLFKNNVTSFWAVIFTVSKVVEFGDTFFLVVRKRPVIFLHWYHHVSVMFFSYYCFHHAIGVARWFMVLNFTVHSFMYTYYFLRSMSIRVPKIVSMAITTMQISQMVAGTAIICLTLLYKRAGLPCNITINEGLVFMGIYVSYFVLFGKFFYETYIRPAKKTRVD